MFSYGAYVQCSISILQGCHPVLLVMSDLLMETGRWMEEWKCVVMERREQYIYDSTGWSFSDAQVTCRQRGYPSECELASTCAQCGYMLLNWYPFIYMGAYKLKLSFSIAGRYMGFILCYHLLLAILQTFVYMYDSTMLLHINNLTRGDSSD